ncbi:MAG: hypothetical protein JSU04_04215, partial [Bdellovibrionales bacterium]|nr:hypothetical protein [Bdellovibrionales bacterium]
MGNYLVLEGAEILEAQGWGGTPGGTFSIQFEDTGCLSVYKQGIFGSKKLISMGFWYLEIVVGTVGIQTGGGFVGGGFGVAGAVRGIAAASLLNALTTKNSEYAVLTTFLTEPNGTEKMCAFGFKHKRESLLRDELAEV